MGFSTESLFGLHLVLRKLLLWLILASFSRKLVQNSIDWTGWAGSCSQKRIENERDFNRKWAWLLKFRERLHTEV